MTYSNTLKSVVSKKKPQSHTHGDLTGRFEIKSRAIPLLQWCRHAVGVLLSHDRPPHRLWQFIGVEGNLQKLSLSSIPPTNKLVGILEVGL